MRTVILVCLLVLPGSGCSFDTAGEVLSELPSGRVFGGPSQDPIFAPFQGEWQFVERKFDPEQQQLRITGGPDIRITGHIIRNASGSLIEEIRLCQVRKTDEGIEGEGWHHEDIHDPGDMQRVDCKLRRIDDKLEIGVRFLGEADYSDDPVIADANYARPNRTVDESVSPWWIETYSPKASNPQVR